MKTRIIAALVGIPPVLAAVFLAGPLLFGAIVLALALLALHEYLRLCAVEPLIAAAVLACAVPVLIAVPAGGAPGVGAAALLALALLSLWRVEDPARRFRGLAEGVLGLCYIGYAMGVPLAAADGDRPRRGLALSRARRDLGGGQRRVSSSGRASAGDGSART